MEKKVIFAIAVLCLLLGVLFVYAAIPLLIPSSGNIITEASLTSDRPSISWGTLYPSNVSVQTLNLTNIGTEPTSPLIITASPTVGTLTNNITGITLNGGESVIAEFTLTVSAAPPTGPFNFDITIND